MVALCCAALIACGGGSSGGDNDDDGGDVGVDGGGDTGVDTGTDPEVCDDGIDNDGDGSADCDDAECFSDAACAPTEETVCDDGVDDDGDGDIDCEDSDCDGDAACDLPTEETVCDDGVDDDGDGDIDCDDADCDGDAACDVAEVCDDTVDNDGDGDVDCDDADCTDDAACVDVEICDDTMDNDGDGDVDCDDADCTDDAACVDVEICDDTMDNDGDGDVDCDDADCADDAACDVPDTEMVCDDGVDDDMDGDVDCDDTDCAADAACLCGNGMIDGDEECDDGTDNSDRLPNACRLDCTLPVCGDGVADDASGEQCDEGMDNDPMGTCTDMCEINLSVACGGEMDIIDLSVDGIPTADGVQYVGNLAGAANDQDPSVGCIGDMDNTGNDIVFIFFADAEGTYEVSTALPSTSADTVVYVRDECSTGELVCNDNDAVGSGSRAYFDATPGRPYFIVVDSLEGFEGPFGLSVTLAGDVAGDGEDCSVNACDVGLLCTDQGDGTSLCRANEAPVVDSLEIIMLDPTTALHTFTGSDVNRDAESLLIPRLLTESGAEVNDITGPVELSWTGDDFVATFTVDWTTLGFVGELGAQVDATIVDALGNEGNIVTATYPMYTPPGTVMAGEACDILRRANVCADPTTCTRDMAGTDTCADPAAPSLDTLDAVRESADVINFLFDGSDANGDVVSWSATFRDAMGMEVGTQIFDFPATSIGQVTFGLNSQINGLTVASGIVSVDAFLIDAAGLESAPLTVSLPIPPVVGEGANCDLAGLMNSCDTGLVCSPGAFGGATCIAPAAPVIDRVEAFADDTGVLVTTTIYGSDANADVTEVEFFFINDAGEAYGFGGTIPSTALTPDPNGQLSFVATLEEVDVSGVPGTVVAVGVQLTDSTLLTSDVVQDPITEAGDGEACANDGTIQCDDAAGLTCNPTTEVCEAADAPVLDMASISREVEDTLVFSYSGTDANGDVTNIFVVVRDSMGAVIAEQAFIIDEDLTGLTTFMSTSTIGGWTGIDAAEIDIAIEDAAGLRSDFITLTVPAVVAEGGACSGDPAVDVCATGTSCTMAGVCGSAAPTISAVAAVYNDVDGTLDFTVEGTDADSDIAEFAIDFLDAPGGTVVQSATVTDATIDYDMGAFVATFSIDWAGSSVWGIVDGELTVTDSLDQSAGPEVFTFGALLGLGDDCSGAGACALGLTCDAGNTDLCITDPVAPCGPGVLALDLLTDGTELSPGVYEVAYDLIGEEDFLSSSCGVDFGVSEIAVSYTAPEDGTLAVTTNTADSVGNDTILFARTGVCTDTDAEIACNDDTEAFLSDISVPLAAGELVYVIIDGWNVGESGTAEFTWSAGLALGEDCTMGGTCGPGLYCDDAGTGLCADALDLGEACDETVPCDAGLFCDVGGSDMCAVAAAEGDMCTDTRFCEGDLICDVAGTSTCEVTVALATGTTTGSESAPYTDTLTCADFATSGAIEFDFFVIDTLAGDELHIWADNSAVGAADLLAVAIDEEGRTYGLAPDFSELDDERACTTEPWSAFACPEAVVVAAIDGQITVAIGQWGGGCDMADAEYTIGLALNGVDIDLSAGPDVQDTPLQ